MSRGYWSADGDLDWYAEVNPEPEPEESRERNCYRCRDGEKACVKGDPSRCDWPHGDMR